jgi:hypothetical protein
MAERRTLLDVAATALWESVNGPIEFLSDHGLAAVRAEAKAVLLAVGFPPEALEQPPDARVVVPAMAEMTAPEAAGRAALLDLASRLEHHGEPPRLCGDAAAVMRALVAEVDRLREALRPFAALVTRYEIETADRPSRAWLGGQGTPDEMPVAAFWWGAGSPATLGDCRRARELLGTLTAGAEAADHG